MPLQSRPCLLNLPRELRQQVITYLFDDALAKDIRLNDFLRNDLRCEMRFSKLPDALRELLTSVRWLQFDPAKIYSPSVDEVASMLTSVHPQMADDVPFVLNVTLKAFEQDLKSVMDREFLSRNDQKRAARIMDQKLFQDEIIRIMRISILTVQQRLIMMIELHLEFGAV